MKSETIALNTQGALCDVGVGNAKEDNVTNHVQKELLKLWLLLRSVPYSCESEKLTVIYAKESAP